MSIYEFLQRVEEDPFDPGIVNLFGAEKPLSEIGMSDFKREITKAAGKNSVYFYFTQSRDAYYADYRPAYPERTAADFCVSLCFGAAVPRLTMYQETAAVPTIKQYHTMSGLLFDLSMMEGNTL